MKSLVILLLLITSALHAQNNIPEEMAGTWELKVPGEGEVPSQIFQWIFYSNDSGENIAEFHWLFKRIEDLDYLTVFAVKGNLVVDHNVFTLSTFTTGSQQIGGKLEFYEEIKWFTEGDPKFDRYPKHESHFFEIEANKLKVQDDFNGDGDFDDQEETTIYTKVN
ncbi:hypothetical protein [Maribellus mangrovi]|uniref:hypothetical protein n=1 Tax=Maribellus mangrovi TaxID=3133146 RepID=UPI0030EEE6E1